MFHDAKAGPRREGERKNFTCPNIPRIVRFRKFCHGQPFIRKADGRLGTRTTQGRTCT
jgi:hypothetical protein